MPSGPDVRDTAASLVIMCMPRPRRPGSTLAGGPPSVVADPHAEPLSVEFGVDVEEWLRRVLGVLDAVGGRLAGGEDQVVHDAVAHSGGQQEGAQVAAHSPDRHRGRRITPVPDLRSADGRRRHDTHAGQAGASIHRFSHDTLPKRPVEVAGSGAT